LSRFNPAYLLLTEVVYNWLHKMGAELMAVRPILKMGEPLLLQTAQRVEQFDTPELAALITDMLDTMRAHNGAGIAAPQIGQSLQVVIFGGFKSPRYPDAEDIPFTVLINPVLTPMTEEQEDGWEGCLSVPGMRGIVPRYAQLRYQGRDQFGTAIDRTVNGFHARVVQHEVDHLLGILYPTRIRDMRQFGFIEALFPGQDIHDD
jgi:peptide deformylase